MKNLFSIICLFLWLGSGAQTLTANPNVASKGQNLSILFSGSNLNFSQGSNTSWIYFEQGSSTIYPNDSHVYDSDHMSESFSIPNWIDCGFYNAIVFGQGSSTLSFPNALNIDCSTTLSGFVYNDVDSNGMNDFEAGMAYATVLAQPGNIFTQTDYFGNYYLSLAAGSYTVSVIPPNYYAQTSLPATYSVTTSSSDTVINGLDFGLHAAPHNDLAVYVVGPNPRVGFTRSYWVVINNQGTTTQVAGMQISLSNGMSLVSSDHSFTTNGNTYTFAPGVSLNPGDELTIALEIYADQGAPLGDSAVITATILNAAQPEETPSNNVDNFVAYYTNSYDPNEKEVLPAGHGVNKEVLNSEALRYQIHFQNTGNDVAYLVKVIDQLNPNLDFKTFKILGSSHPVTYDISQTGLVTFTFSNINLPDSAADLQGSNGFVSFSIQPKPSLPEHTVITNTANIYFDFNPAVVTNTTSSNMVTQYTGVAEIGSDTRFSVYPNPASDVLNISSPETKITELIVYDMLGKSVLDQKLNNNLATLQISQLEKGSYMVKIVTADGDGTKHFTVIR